MNFCLIGEFLEVSHNFPSVFSFCWIFPQKLKENSNMQLKFLFVANDSSIKKIIPWKFTNISFEHRKLSCEINNSSTQQLIPIRNSISLQRWNITRVYKNQHLNQNLVCFEKSQNFAFFTIFKGLKTGTLKKIFVLYVLEPRWTNVPNLLHFGWQT